MSRPERRSFEIDETRRAVFEACGWRCVYVDAEGHRCPEPCTEAAHILPQDVQHLRRYGPEIVHHMANMRGTCQSHNASVQINYDNQPLRAEAHAAKIRAIVTREAGKE